MYQRTAATVLRAALEQCSDFNAMGRNRAIGERRRLRRPLDQKRPWRGLLGKRGVAIDRVVGRMPSPDSLPVGDCPTRRFGVTPAHNAGPYLPRLDHAMFSLSHPTPRFSSRAPSRPLPSPLSVGPIVLRQRFAPSPGIPTIPTATPAILVPRAHKLPVVASQYELELSNLNVTISPSVAVVPVIVRGMPQPSENPIPHLDAWKPLLHTSVAHAITTFSCWPRWHPHKLNSLSNLRSRSLVQHPIPCASLLNPLGSTISQHLHRPIIVP